MSPVTSFFVLEKCCAGVTSIEVFGSHLKEGGGGVTLRICKAVDCGIPTNDGSLCYAECEFKGESYTCPESWQPCCTGYCFTGGTVAILRCHSCTSFNSCHIHIILKLPYFQLKYVERALSSEKHLYNIMNPFFFPLFLDGKHQCCTLQPTSSETGQLADQIIIL